MTSAMSWGGGAVKVMGWHEAVKVFVDEGSLFHLNGN